MKKITIWSIRCYQLATPLLRQVLISVFGFSIGCPQTPSCSQYTILQIQNHGTITGLKNGLTRVANCHNLCKQLPT